MKSFGVQPTVQLHLPQVEERPRTRPSRSRSSGRHPAIIDSGAYRAHFRRWWEDEGRAQQDQKEDPLETIDKRLHELNKMVTPRKTVEGTMQRLETPLRDKVRELSLMTPKTFRNVRRRDRHSKLESLRHFQRAIRLVLIAVKIYRQRRRYVQSGPVRGPLDSDVKSDEYGQSWFKTKGTSGLDGTPSKTVIGPEFQCHFRMQPDYKTTEELERIALKIRTIKAFQMFPTKMEEELCRRVSYECYDDGRVLAYQGSLPQRFIYIITGQVRLLRTYKLQSGEVTKAVGTQSKGYFTPREDLENLIRRDCHHVCRGNVEVLILDREDFLYLIDPPADPPLKFLRSHSMFKEFPVDEFYRHPETIKCQYYPPDTIICRDANKTKWIHIVMSGECHCLRKQLISSGESDGRSPRIEMVGGGPLGRDKRQRRPSHADEMIEMSIARYIAKRTSIPTLPEIRTTTIEDTKMTRNPHGTSLGLPLLDREESGSHSPHSGASSRRPSVAYSLHDVPALALGDTIHEDRHMVSPSRGTSRSQRRGTNMFLTERARTDASIVRSRRRSRSHPLPGPSRRAHQQKPVFLQLGKLQSGDVFGLNELAGTLCVEPCGVTVVSGGAEVITVNKRFFRQHAGVLTLLTLEGMIHEFASEEDATDILSEQDIWTKYKQSVVDTLATKKVEKTKERRGGRMRLHPLTYTV